MSFQLSAASQTHPGQVRQVNEDSVFCFIRPPDKGAALGLLIVADGIGGHKAGDIASKLAVETIYEGLSYFLDKDEGEDTRPLNKEVVESVQPDVNNPETFMETRLRMAIEDANLKIIEYARNNPKDAGNMGTTLTCALIWNEKVVVAHIGDSRAYRLRAKELEQLTEDHSFVGELVREGQLPYEAYYVHPRRNVITRALGQFEAIDIDLWTGDLETGDKLLLCSDGLWEMIRNPQLRDLLSEKNNLSDTADTMVEIANTNGGPDNISVVLGEILANTNGTKS